MTIPRRTVLRAGVGLAAGAGLGAIALRPGRARQAVPPGRTAVTYWEKWTGAEGAALQAIVDDFNASQSDVWVHRLPVSDIMRKAMVAIGGGDPPDLVGLFDFNLPLFAEAGALLPLDEMARGTDVALERYAPAVRRLLVHEGRWWAGVTTCHSMALYANLDLLATIGADERDLPRTTDELLALSQRLEVVRADGRLERAGFLPNVPFWWPYLWPTLFAGRLYDAERHRVTLDEPACRRAYGWVADWARRLGAGPTTTFAAGFGRSFLSENDPFIAGRQALIAQGPWMANFVRLHRPSLRYAAVPLPTPPELVDPARPVGLLEADVIAIPRGAREPGAAFAFVRHLQRRDVAERLARAHTKGSPLAEHSPDFAAGHPNPSIAVHDAIAASPRATMAPRTRVWPQYAAMIQSAFDAIWARADAAETTDAQRDRVAAELGAVQARVQALVDTTVERRARRARA